MRRATGAADQAQHQIDAILFRRTEQPPVAGLRGDEQCAADLAIVRRKADRLAAERMADHRKRQSRPDAAHVVDRGGDIERRPVAHAHLEAAQRGRTRARCPAIVIGENRESLLRQIGRKAAIDLARHRGRRIDQDRAARCVVRREHRRAERVAVARRDRRVLRQNFLHRRVAQCLPSWRGGRCHSRHTMNSTNSTWMAPLWMNSASGPIQPIIQAATVGPTIAPIV